MTYVDFVFGIHADDSRITYICIALECITILILIFCIFQSIRKYYLIQKPVPREIYPYNQTYCLFSAILIGLLIFQLFTCIIDCMIDIYKLTLSEKEYWQLVADKESYEDFCDTKILIITPFYIINHSMEEINSFLVCMIILF